ncbi:MAG: UbiH/UbiF family hydroxylase [Burkholderiaceae bacterium]|jgi:2-octaprenylphenol hydroxylase|nr:UbiH/UbiF family hydroxylase [Burkholderiaceae bacterium]
MERQASGFDAAVVGPGIAGLATALGLAQQGLKVALIGPRPRVHRATDAAPFDPRIYALAPGGAALLERLGAWGRVDADRTCPVERMRVFGDAGDELTFDAYAATVERLATIVEESELLRVLDAACDYQPSIARLDAQFQALRQVVGGVEVELADGSRIDATLLVGADGANSAVRAAAGISADATLYRQTALVANFTCERPHLNTAWQWFTEEGIVALLPLPGERVSLVWSAPDHLAPELRALDAASFAGRVSERSHRALGGLASIGAVHAFPLRLLSVRRLIGPALALVGDAAHVVHPLAGQGLNLGLQDVDALLRAVGGREAFRSAGDGVVLRRYERARAEAVALMRVTTDGLARLFAIDDPLVRGARNAGMALVNRLKPLKSRLIRQALG